MVEYDPPGVDDAPGFPIRDWLTPVGDTGLYISPLDPVDPWDCDRYPNSPYCNNVIEPNDSFDSEDLTSLLPTVAGVSLGDLINVEPFTLQPGFSINECEVCFDLDGTFFYLPTATWSICYRRASCRNPPDPPPPPGLPPPDGGSIPWTDRFPNCEKVAKFERKLHRDAFIVRGTGEVVPVVHSPTEILVTRIDESNVILGEIAGFEWSVSYTESPGLHGIIDPSFYWNFYVIRPNGNKETIYSAQPTYYVPSAPGTTRSFPAPLPRFIGVELVPGQPSPCNSISFPFPHPIPPPPIPPQDMNCNCCTDTEDLLRLIARRLGTASYPVKVPEYLVTNQGNRSINIESLTQFVTWITYQLDALAGEFPVEIEIKDIDPATEGDQKQKVKLFNIAESLAEMYALTVKNTVNSDVHTNFLIRMVSELIATKNATLITQDYAKANADFLGYEGNPTRRKIPYSFDVEGRESLDKLLKNSEKEIEGWESKTKDTALEYFHRLMFAAGIIKAVYYRTPRDLDRMMKELERAIDPDGDDAVRDDAAWDAFLNAINDPANRFNQNAPKPKIVDPKKAEREARKQRNAQRNQPPANSDPTNQPGQPGQDGRFNNLDGGGR